jgi:parvulin-like peptidyl-prolyl isomerase
MLLSLALACAPALCVPLADPAVPSSGFGLDAGSAPVGAPLDRRPPGVALGGAAQDDGPQEGEQDDVPEGFERTGRGTLRVIDRSFFNFPLALEEAPPPTVAARHMQFVYDGCIGAPRELNRTPEQAMELAGRIREQLLAGADFRQISLHYSDSNQAEYGGNLGTLIPGTVAPALEEFLWSAEVGELSEPLMTQTGVHLAQRVEQWVGARMIKIDGQSQESFAKAQALLRELANGADFQELAREHSTDALTRERGGDLVVFERGPRDTLVKQAAFDAELGEVVGPIRGPFHLYLVQRVAPEALDRSLREATWIQLRGLFLTHDQASMALPPVGRNANQTLALAEALAERIAAGEDMAALCAEFNDDPQNGRERRGLVGWIHRNQPSLPNFVADMFKVEVGELVGPLPTEGGWVLMRRER